MSTIERTEPDADTGPMPSAGHYRFTSPRTLVGGRYRLGSHLGRGASGTVWLARDEKLGRPVAVKELPRELAMHPGAGRAEARSAACVDHRSVVTVHDFVAEEGNGVDWIVMEALSGQTLATAIRRHGPIDTDEAWYVAGHLLDALCAVHAAGLTHGDVKPGNVQLCSDGRVVLLDFGLADMPRRTGGSDRNLVAGSLPYMAPEILHSGDYSLKSDLYALGMTLFVAVTGRTPSIDIYDRRYAVPEMPAGCGALGDVMTGLLDPDPRTRISAAAVARACRRRHGARRGGRTSVAESSSLPLSAVDQARTGGNRQGPVRCTRLCEVDTRSGTPA